MSRLGGFKRRNTTRAKTRSAPVDMLRGRLSFLDNEDGSNVESNGIGGILVQFDVLRHRAIQIVLLPKKERDVDKADQDGHFDKWSDDCRKRNL